MYMQWLEEKRSQKVLRGMPRGRDAQEHMYYGQGRRMERFPGRI